MIEVREAEPGDRRETARIARRVNAAIQKVYQVQSSGSKQRFASTKHRQLVATVDGAIIGAAHIAHHGERTHLVGLFVDPDYHGCGVAGHLVEAVAQVARKRGAKRVTLRTVRETGNVHVFEQLGFEVIEEHETDTVQGAGGALLSETSMERLL